MNDVLNEAALQSAPQVLSTAATPGNATASDVAPIKSMFWADQSGAPLVGTADYGGVVSLCVVSGVPGLLLDVAVFKTTKTRPQSYVTSIASGRFVSGQPDQAFRLDVNTHNNPNVYGDTLLEGTVKYSGTPSGTQQVKTPSLSMNIVPYVRTVMRARGWLVGAACQDRWFTTPYAPAKTAVDLVFQDILTMKWATSFSYIARVVENGFINATLGESVLAADVRDKVKDRIKAQVRNGLVALPANDGDTVAFGTKAQDLELDAQGHNFPRFNRYFVHEVGYSVAAASFLEIVPHLPPLDDFTAAVGDCQFRFIALGQIAKTGDSFKVSVTELGAYIFDYFNFDGEQDLGSWNAKTNDVSRPYIGVTSEAYTHVTNDSYRAWRQRNARGMDYTNISDILSRQVNFAFPASPAELRP